MRAGLKAIVALRFDGVDWRPVLSCGHLGTPDNHTDRVLVGRFEFCGVCRLQTFRRQEDT